MKEEERITPIGSHTTGLFVSAVTGIVVFVVVWALLKYTLDFWYIGEVLGPAVGIFLGGLSAFEMFTQRLRLVPLNWVGVRLYLGKPTGEIYQNGTHWVPPFFEIIKVPASTEKFSIEMEGEEINAQDGITLFFGLSEHGGKNRMMYSVVDPTLYIATNDPESDIQGVYLEDARLFFGQISNAIGVKNEQTLFNAFLALPPNSDPAAKAEYAAFKDRLQKAKFGAGERLFSDDAVFTIMAKAGHFAEKVASWGIGNIVSFTPIVRVNPIIERAAAQKQVAVEEMIALDTRAQTINMLAKKMCKEAGINPDLAVTMVAALSGQKVDIANKTINIAGVPEALSVLKEVIDKLAKK